MLIEIKRWDSEKVIFSGEYSSIKEAVEDAVKKSINLSYADLPGANFVRADFIGANFAGANFVRADFTGANFAGANLYRSNFLGANLSGANFHGANLSWANFYMSDFSWANLAKANLLHSNFLSAKLSWSNLSGACIDSHYCYFSVSPIGIENSCLWVIKNNEGKLIFNIRDFKGNEKEFIKMVKSEYHGTEYKKKYLEAVKFIKSQVRVA